MRVETLGNEMVQYEGKCALKVRSKMSEVRINWSEYIREAIRKRIELEKKRRAAEKLLEGLKQKRHIVPSGFINETIREMRKAR
jgi:predicted nucleic acid-binding protein